MVELKIWSSREIYKTGAPPCIVIDCQSCYLSKALRFIRTTFVSNFVCLIEYKS